MGNKIIPFIIFLSWFCAVGLCLIDLSLSMFTGGTISMGLVVYYGWKVEGK